MIWSWPRRRLAVPVVVAVVLAAAIVNHARVRHHSTPAPATASVLATASVRATATVPAPTVSAVSACPGSVTRSDLGMLTVGDVWPGSAGGGRIYHEFGRCPTHGSATATTGSCPAVALSESVASATADVRLAGALGIRVQQLVHAPHAAVTEIVVHLSTAPAARRLAMACAAAAPSAEVGDLLMVGAVGAQLVVLDFDDPTQTATSLQAILAVALRRLT